jgi:hypothetical protein
MKVNRTECSVEPSSLQAGLQVRHRLCSRSLGSSASPRGSRFVGCDRLLLVPLLVLAVMLLCVAPAMAESPLAETNPVHGIVGEDIVLYGIANANGASEATYHFEYVSEEDFKAGEWAQAMSTPKEAIGEGGVSVHAQLAGLKAGVTYEFRLTLEAPDISGHPQHGSTRTFTTGVPGKTAPGVEDVSQPSPCANEALRAGPSSRLPDCRAYEQVTPADKEGAQDLESGFSRPKVVIGLDGEHLVIEEAQTKFGEAGGSAGLASSYYFARTPAGWQMTPIARQPQAGIFSEFVSSNSPFTPDLSEALFTRFWDISFSDRSPSEELMIGPPGGPYTAVAALTRAAGGAEESQWVAVSRGGTTAVFAASEDHEVIPGHPTGTTSGEDLYEYANGHLSQLNVATGGATIGVCGAKIAHGYEAELQGSAYNTFGHAGSNGAINSISSDGSRVFFYASPGGGACPSYGVEEENGEVEVSPNRDLYMRLDGETTVNIGSYQFVGANPEGTRVILRRGSGQLNEYFLYHTENGTLEPIPKLRGGYKPMLLSEDGNVIYLGSHEEAQPDGVSRYDINAEKLTFITNFIGGHGGGGYYTSPNGDQLYWGADGVEGLPGSSNVTNQLYRYDSVEEAIQCVACSSLIDPEPGFPSVTITETGAQLGRPSPLGSPASANGDFVFFETIAALVPQDINGEVGGGESEDGAYSPSSDVYEWRRNGIDGCAHVQGCLALITDGIDPGAGNKLLGTDPSGRDVFFATKSQLVATDRDSSTDIYDARIGGGYPPPAPPLSGCEGTECSRPANPPEDATPGSFTFSGPGNPAPTLAGKSVAKPKKHGKKKRTKKRVRRKARRVHGRAGRTTGRKS